ncbi:MAG: protein kinase [Deltaproteobacteria bacterium]|nr:protein kinase [Deltaproteobacteria bacterium]
MREPALQDPHPWTPPELHRIDRLVLEAAALEAAHRDSFLARQAASEKRLVEEVQRRLTAAQNLPENFLASPASLFIGDLTLEGAPGESLPFNNPPDLNFPGSSGEARYALKERLGSGGMASVYRAFDRQLDRHVALKLFRAGDASIPIRLLTEARAQARIRHDHVLEIYETGSFQGRPFITMRLVVGATLAEKATELSLEQKIRLLEQTARGLHAAHRQGLLHRDVKPSNILVETSPEGDLKAWVSDFGIATELQGARAASDLFGTPHYMAPERFAATPTTLDRRSDVFSFGVTLYQLLSGRLPFAGEDLVEIRRNLLHSPSPSLENTAPPIPADLRAIVLKCLAKNPQERYPTARAVALDLQRFLDGEIVEAHTASLAYRLTRFAQRHRSAVAVAGTLAVLLVLALMVAAGLGLRAVQAQAREEQRRAQAEELIRFMVLDLRQRLEPLGRLEVLDAVGQKALDYFAAVPEERLTETELGRRSTALYQIGEVYLQQGSLAKAVPPLLESLELSQRLADRAPHQTDRLFGLGQSHFWVGFAHWEAGNGSAARPHFEAYLDLSRRLVDAEPGNNGFLLELAYAESNLAALLERAGEIQAARRRYANVLGIMADLVTREPTNSEWKFELAAAHNSLGEALRALGELEAATQHFRQELGLRQELASLDPAHRPWEDFLGTSHQHLGTLLLYRGRWEEAREHLSAGFEIFTRLTAEDPTNAIWQYKEVWSRLRLGELLWAQEERDDALALWQLAADLTAPWVNQQPPQEGWQRTSGVVALHLSQGEEDPSPGLVKAIGKLRAHIRVFPDDRRARTWLGTALLRLAEETNPPELNEALLILESLAENSSDFHHLAPWARALLRAHRLERARPVLERLWAVGYRDRELEALSQEKGLPVPLSEQ